MKINQDFFIFFLLVLVFSEGPRGGQNLVSKYKGSVFASDETREKCAVATLKKLLNEKDEWKKKDFDWGKKNQKKLL